MDIDEAVKKLDAHLNPRPSWLTAIGVIVDEDDGTESIVVYASRLGLPEQEALKAGWMDFPIVIRKMGRPRPCK